MVIKTRCHSCMKHSGTGICVQMGPNPGTAIEMEVCTARNVVDLQVHGEIRVKCCPTVIYIHKNICNNTMYAVQSCEFQLPAIQCSANITQPRDLLGNSVIAKPQ